MSRSLIVVILSTVFGAYFVAPSIIFFSLPKSDRTDPAKVEAAIPNWLPKQHVKLGLDIQGGVQLVLGVNTDEAIEGSLGRLGVEIARWADDGGVAVKSAYVVKGKRVLRVEANDEENLDKIRETIAAEYPQLEYQQRDGLALDYQFENTHLDFIRKGANEQAERVVRTRIDKWGVSEPVINRRMDGSVLVQLPGFSDPERAKELLGKTAQLQFKIVDDEFAGFEGVIAPEGIERTGTASAHPQFTGENKDALIELLQPHIPPDSNLFFEREAIAGGNKYRYTSYVTKAAVEISGEDILDAYVTTNTDSLDRSPAVGLRFTNIGAKRFADVTGANVRKRLAIILDEEIVSAPVINSRISGGQASISMGAGDYSKIHDQARNLAMILKSGALPATIVVLEERLVGATLGPELAEQGVRAIVVGLVLVLLYMLIYYRRTGIVACFVLILNGVLLLAVLAGFGAALTLPGIAGFILTLGMAVDANVLINERIRQELRDSKNAKKAFNDGFDRVYWTILDANITTLIAALVLLETNSSGPIRGFAITLMAGLGVSLFTSLFCTRVILQTVVDKATSENDIRKWFGSSKPRGEAIKFLNLQNAAFTIVGLILVAFIATASTKGFNWSVDFAGGMEMEIVFAEDVDPNQIRAAVQQAGVKDLVLQSLENSRRKYLLRFEQQEESGESFALEIANKIRTNLGEQVPDIQRTDFVGPQIGKEMRTNGLMSILWALIGVFAYVALRFDLRFAPAAVAKMVVDVVVMLSFYVFFWRSFDLTSVAALLTVVGYSVNDAIVIFDRIRENIQTNPQNTLVKNLNISLTDTLSRTINTSVTTVLSLVGILIFGTSQLWNFAAAMGVGVASATLSSIFFATAVVLVTENYKQKAKA
jgi:SecD/SecF fusion protein